MRLTPLALALSASLLLSACGASDTPADGVNAAPADAVAAAADTTAPAADETAARNAHLDPMDAVLAGDWRDPANTPRDAWRHPRETLAFFGVGPSQRIVEISPGGGWYTEILAPLARGKGSYTGVINDPAKAGSERATEYYAKNNQKLRDKLATRADVYGNATLLEIDPKAPVIGEPGSADVVLTFRNVHNWVNDGSEAAMFKAFFDALRPGGVLGVVEHRAAAGKTLEEVKDSGYLPEDYVIGLATAAGFVLEEKSEINANPADTKDHPNGVWTLPPSNNHEEADKAKYAAIGESDRMTLRFVKPQGEAAAETPAQ
ncbi:class I SAM-dependent methyltransferase [Arenimonas terrae]|uniref:Methyltransferase domain-containing protein n=1 Tax=Arenimonas terrae TaxID=2546226 RepID=A0A5C4RNE6_9GAMM|nr:class I SAM-dependent methyltransferase [Arenimonas terrae]TNJ32650.1 methyltransferase domain-containing protein [Arenimonas terrae]